MTRDPQNSGTAVADMKSVEEGNRIAVYMTLLDQPGLEGEKFFVGSMPLEIYENNINLAEFFHMLCHNIAANILERKVGAFDFRWIDEEANPTEGTH